MKQDMNKIKRLEEGIDGIREELKNLSSYSVEYSLKFFNLGVLHQALGNEILKETGSK